MDGCDCVHCFLYTPEYSQSVWQVWVDPIYYNKRPLYARCKRLEQIYVLSVPLIRSSIPCRCYCSAILDESLIMVRWPTFQIFYLMNYETDRTLILRSVCLTNTSALLSRPPSLRLLPRAKPSMRVKFVLCHFPYYFTYNTRSTQP